MMELDRSLAGLRWLRDKTTCFACSGCGMEHNCSDDGCRIIRSAIEQVQRCGTSKDNKHSRSGKDVVPVRFIFR